jgi:hypothetical protein
MKILCDLIEYLIRENIKNGPHFLTKLHILLYTSGNYSKACELLLIYLINKKYLT